jgi:type I restriction enzyme S subunit
MKFVTIDELATVVRGSSPRPQGDPRYYGGNIPRLMVSDVTRDGMYVTPKIDFLTEEGSNKSRPMKQGDFIIAVSGDPGEPCILSVDACIHDGFVGLRDLDVSKVYIPYLYRFFKYNKLKSKAQAVGAIYKNLNTDQIKGIQIPLPPLSQQQKIANILDAADELRQNDKVLVAKYDELTQALFLDMFGDPVSNPQGWEIKTIEQIVKSGKGSIKRGPFGGALKKEIFVEDGYLVYEQFHALNNDFSRSRYFIDQNKFNELQGFEVQPGDIIISCSGVYLGKLAIIPQNARKGIINQALLKVTLDESKMTNDFFVFLFSHKNFREKYFDANRGAGIPNFPPMSEFKKFPFISPPMELQNQFTEQVAIIEDQKNIAQITLAKSEELFNSLLQKAFIGEL